MISPMPETVAAARTGRQAPGIRRLHHGARVFSERNAGETAHEPERTRHGGPSGMVGARVVSELRKCIF